MLTLPKGKVHVTLAGRKIISFLQNENGGYKPRTFGLTRGPHYAVLYKVRRFMIEMHLIIQRIYFSVNCGDDCCFCLHIAQPAQEAMMHAVDEFKEPNAYRPRNWFLLS